MKKFYLIRHGDKVREKGDATLTELGHEQAKKTANILTNKEIEKIYVSPYKRTQQTASYISNKLQLPVTIHELLVERSNWGDDPIQTYEQFAELWEYCSKNRDFLPPIGESSRQAGYRLEKFIEEVYTNDRATKIAVIAHGGIIADFLRNVFTEDILNTAHPEFIDRHALTIKTCSITEIDYDGQQYNIRCLANIDHL